MAIVKAVVENKDDKHFITITLEGSAVNIPLSDDRPVEVKSAFNKLITRLKSGAFQIELEAGKDDLFWQVANEYLTQLNRELKEVSAEMAAQGLMPKAPEEAPAGDEQGAVPGDF